VKLREAEGSKLMVGSLLYFCLCAKEGTKSDGFVGKTSPNYSSRERKVVFIFDQNCKRISHQLRWLLS